MENIIHLVHRQYMDITIFQNGVALLVTDRIRRSDPVTRKNTPSYDQLYGVC